MKLFYLLLASLFGSFLYGEKVNIKEINKLIDYENKNIVIVDKSKVNNYLAKEEKTVVSKKELMQKEQKAKVLTITSIEEYILNINSINTKTYNLNIMDLLLATEYVFTKKIQSKHYPELKKLLLIEGKKYHELDYSFYSDAVKNMNLEIAKELIEVVKGNIS